MKNGVINLNLKNKKIKNWRIKNMDNYNKEFSFKQKMNN